MPRTVFYLRIITPHTLFYLQIIPLLKDYDDQAERETSLEKIGDKREDEGSSLSGGGSKIGSCESLDDAEALVRKDSAAVDSAEINPELTEVEVREDSCQ